MAKIKGIWIFNESVFFNGGQWYTVNFTCDGVSYVAMSDKSKQSSSQHDMCIKYHKADGTYILVQNGGDNEWVDAKYRTVDFGETEQEVVDAFLTWMQANATYQVVNPTFQIKYKENNVDIELGKITTLHVSNKKLTGDIVVVAPVVEQYEVWDGSCTISGNRFTLEYSENINEFASGVTHLKLSTPPANNDDYNYTSEGYGFDEGKYSIKLPAGTVYLWKSGDTPTYSLNGSNNTSILELYSNPLELQMVDGDVLRIYSHRSHGGGSNE